jgi:hypothetical protein
MNVKLRLYILVILLMGLGIGLILYKHYVLGFPLLPDHKKSVWTVEAKVDFTARGDPVIVSFALPPQTPDIIFTQEEFASPDYGFSELPSTAGRRAQWSKRTASGPQTAYYRLSMYEADHNVASQQQVICRQSLKNPNLMNCTKRLPLLYWSKCAQISQYRNIGS